MDLNQFMNSAHFNELNKIIKSTKSKLEGNCIYHHSSRGPNKVPFEIHTEKKELRNNLFKIAKMNNNILEIGFNGGHSAALYFYANPDLKLLSFDICSHKYTELAVNYLKTKFNLEFVKGDSTIEVPKYNSDIKYDVIHIDGGHGEDCAKKDLKNCKKYANKNTLLIFDDSNFSKIRIILNDAIDYNFIEEINYNDYNLEETEFHRIFKYCF